jgi:hypothetical protein
MYLKHTALPLWWNFTTTTTLSQVISTSAHEKPLNTKTSFSTSSRLTHASLQGALHDAEFRPTSGHENREPVTVLITATSIHGGVCFATTTLVATTSHSTVSFRKLSDQSINPSNADPLVSLEPNTNPLDAWTGQITPSHTIVTSGAATTFQPSYLSTIARATITPVTGSSIVPTQATKSAIQTPSLEKDSLAHSQTKKVGLAVGSSLILLLLSAVLFFFCRKRPRHRLLGRPISKHPSIRPIYCTADYSPYHEVVREDANECPRSGLTVVDKNGVIWPEEVVLVGDAKDYNEWTKAYAEDYRMRMNLRGGGGNREYSWVNARTNDYNGGFGRPGEKPTKQVCSW